MVSRKEANEVFPKIAKILGIFVFVFTIITLTLVIWVLRRDLKGTEFFSVLGILIPIGIALFGAYLEFAKKKNRIHVAYISVLLYLAGALVSLIIIRFDFDLEMENIEAFRFVVFILFYVISGLCCAYFYPSARLLIEPSSDVKIAKILIVVGLMFIIFNSLVLGIGGFRVTSNTISNGTGFTEGPWALFHDDTETSITIAWLTESKNSTVVYYGKDPNSLNLVYSTSKQVNLHRAVLTGLDPNTIYYYRIPEDFVTEHASTLFRFKTGSSDATSFRFAVFGDKQPTSEHLLTSNGFVADGLIAGGYDFALQVGDLASSGTDMNDWHKVLQSLSRIGATTPLQMAIGNHDWDGILGAANWRALFPYNFESGPGASYYSFDYGNAHFVMIDNFEIFYRMSDAQLSWIEKDIADAKARGQVWTFALFHLSLFTTATSGFYEGLKLQLLPLFDRSGVDAVFFGHDHHYEYYNYTYGGNGLTFSPDHKWDHKAVQYFCTGGGGANLEVDYGLFNPRDAKYQLNWFNSGTRDFETRYYYKNEWNKSRYVSNPSFSINYTQYSASGEHDGKYYYHAPQIEQYANFTSDFGFVYGEQSYHFMDISIDGNTCIIRAVYPNGQMLRGPNDSMPQEIILKK